MITCFLALVFDLYVLVVAKQVKYMQLVTP